jgi:hypothetical protein
MLACTAGAASAQMIFDGNIVYQENNSGTLAGQFIGTPPAPAAGCPAGTSSATLGTITYTHNTYQDPLLSSGLYVPGVIPGFQPAAGSPAYNRAMNIPNTSFPNDGFFTPTCYQGAVGPNPGDDWTQGWSYWDTTGADRHDLHLASNGDPNPRPNAVYNNINLYSDQFWSPDSNYEIFGQLRVKSQTALHVAPGVVIREDAGTLGTIIVERGGKMYAIGNKCEPIIITSNAPPGQQERGQCGGVVLNGRGRSNSPIVNGVGVGTCNGDSVASEGGAIGYFGGTDTLDCSGVLRYVRIEYSGKEITPNNELNSFTFNGCGRNTHGDYLEAYDGADDSFEWFGGDMDQKYLLSVDNTDDVYDWQLGTHNRAQFVIGRQTAVCAPEGCSQFGDKGIEADNNEFDYTASACTGHSNCIVANMTIIGDKRTGLIQDGLTVRDGTFGSTYGVNFRRGTAGTCVNSIFWNQKFAGLKVDDDITWQYHCAAPPAVPSVHCGFTTAVGPDVITTGDVFVARSAPNPFSDQVAVSFELPKGGPVSVEIYSADGRHIETLAKGQMAAGPHTLSWKLSKDVPTGVYFYRVNAGSSESSGKMVRVD